MEYYQLITFLKGHSHYVTSVSWSADGKQLASGSWDKRVGIWDMERKELITFLKGHSGSVESVSWSPTGHQLASGSHDHSVGIWDMERQELITFLKGHLSTVNSVEWSSSGKQLASGSSDDHAVFLWVKQPTGCSLVEKWQLIHRFEITSSLSAHGAFLKDAKISPNNLALLKQKGANDDQDVPEYV
jgi:WD40 repeat protein